MATFTDNLLETQLFHLDCPDTVDTKYSLNVSVPQYLPSASCPNLLELYDNRKYKKLLRNIKESNIPEDIKDFLSIAATRHIVFNYSKIADYYAHATKEVQQLMEESALVIIDINDAIANGYVKLSGKMADIIDRTGKPASTITEENVVK